MYCFFFFFKQKTAYDMRISDWSSDVCSSDIYRGSGADLPTGEGIVGRGRRYRPSPPARPALTCPVAGFDFPPVLNSTEPAEIMFGKAAPALRYGSSSPSLFSARTGIYARQYRHRQPRIRQSRSRSEEH